MRTELVSLKEPNLTSGTFIAVASSENVYNTEEKVSSPRGVPERRSRRKGEKRRSTEVP